MGKLAGLVLIAAGVGTAAYVYPMVGSGGDRADRQLSEVVAITTGAVPAGQPQPSRPPSIVVKPAGTPDTQRVVSAETAPGRLPLTTSATKPSSITSMAPAQVLDATNARPIEVPQPVAGKRPAKGDDEAKLALTRDIQRELKRVGCFEGNVDGAWSPETRQAMKSFIDRVNATLPVDDPDHILKTLVQGHPGNACGKSCPSGQVMNSDSRCLPTAIIAQVPKRQLAPVREAAAAGAVAAPKSSSWEAKVVPTPEPVRKPEPRPAQIVSAPEPAADPRPSASVQPLPGRTALGATGVPAPGALAPITDAESARAKRPVITVKPRDAATNIAAVTPPDATAPAIGAIAAAVTASSPPPASAKPPVTEQPERRARPAPTIVARPPPPPPQRIVNSYTPPSASRDFRERPRFGPQIFRELERSGR